jgi:hypothetical protein
MGPGEEDDGHPRSRPTALQLESPMNGRLGTLRDPFEGYGAVRTRRRLRVEGLMALALAIVACGLTAAVWMRELAPLAHRLGLG